MKKRLLIGCLFLLALSPFQVWAEGQRFAYVVSDLRIPFWQIMWRGVQDQARMQGDEVFVLSADNSAKKELENMVHAIRERVDGIVLSPMNSSSAVTLLKLAEKASIPVVISDIGTQGGRFVSYIESDNEAGAYQLGLILANELQQRQLLGSVGIIAIPQDRQNGKLRTQGFLSALSEAGLSSAYIHQQSDFSYEETLNFSRALIRDYPDLKAIWLQGSDRYRAALEAIREADKEDDILLICFDAEPEFIELIQQGVLAGAGMQQPFLMGARALSSLDQHLSGRAVPRVQQLDVLAVSRDNIDKLLPTIRRNVLGLPTR
ncbi:substrate-binding domain-containing protein [Oceanospirillum sp. HFRX-1_2]